jgi:hypothetical protein
LHDIATFYVSGNQDAIHHRRDSGVLKFGLRCRQIRFRLL